MIDRYLCRAHARAVECPLVARVVAFTRFLLAGGFAVPGLVKLLGCPFTILQPETPVGAFFDALWKTGGYWRFLGLMQVLGGLLLVIPRTALLGACICFGLTLNIAVLTVAIGFRGTGLVACAMLTATVFLLLWDYPALRPLLGLSDGQRPSRLSAVDLSASEWTGAVLSTTCAWLSTWFVFGTLRWTLPAAVAAGGGRCIVGGLMLFGPAWSARARTKRAL